ncbi:MAG: sigma-54-dependent Fis family transcriptional regulator [Acidobacteria bacterium]|nr:sigma-54-dependent Fis family transcriptional regulator [Acidobacteriota bacterium]
MVEDSKTQTAHELLASEAAGASHAAQLPPVPALTVLCHPDLERLGDRCLLGELCSHRSVSLSRLFPDFENPEAGVARPLEDVFLSRTPLRISPRPGGGVLLDRADSRTLLEVDDRVVTRTLELSRDRLEAGVVLQLSGRVALLLHLHRRSSRRSVQRFGLVGESDAMVSVREAVSQVADLEVPVLLRGETGTGKELVARAIHSSSGRRAGPFLSVNVGAIPPSLAAAELFGAVKGAFTGSIQASAGYFQRAEGGTLFLDEVGETPPEVQVALLRVLETGEIQRVGSQASQRVDVRLVAATDADLEAEIRSGRFRAPLLHRLGGFEIVLPPLRQRRDDFGRLLGHFLRQELERIGELDRLHPTSGPEPWLPAPLVAALVRHEWPGNIRQLRNVVRQLVIDSRGRERLTVGPPVERVLAEAVVGPSTGRVTVPPPLPSRHLRPDETPTPPPRAASRPANRSPADVGEEELLAALRNHRWKLKPTARALGLARTSLYMLVDRHPRVRKAADLGREELARCFEACGGDVERMVDRLEVSAAGLRQRLKELGLYRR